DHTSKCDRKAIWAAPRMGTRKPGCQVLGGTRRPDRAGARRREPRGDLPIDGLQPPEVCSNVQLSFPIIRDKAPAVGALRRLLASYRPLLHGNRSACLCARGVRQRASILLPVPDRDALVLP